VSTPERHSPLGQRLREARTRKGLSLRLVASRAGINHGYLSQLERGEITQPSPAALHRLADAYEEPFPVLMRWAGYIRGDDAPLTDNQARALSYLGKDISDEELAAIRAVLDAIRGRRATFAAGGALDLPLDPVDATVIREHMTKLLKAADVWGVIPVPLEAVMDAADLVRAGEISLDSAEKKLLRSKFGALVDQVLTRLQGVIHVRAREVWVKPGMYEPRRRFVTAHEIGHGVLPWQQETLAYLDDERRLSETIRIRYEREANHAAIELLAHGDLLRKEADDSALSLDLVGRLANRYQLSLQAAARRVVEESQKPVALAIAFRNERTCAIGPPHYYSSAAFENQLHWHATSAARRHSKEAVTATIKGQILTPLLLAEEGCVVHRESLDSQHAILVLFRPLTTSTRRLPRLLQRR
jgi:transcriptional regulator with XRE-family HTH domain